VSPWINGARDRARNADTISTTLHRSALAHVTAARGPVVNATKVASTATVEHHPRGVADAACFQPAKA